MGMYTELNIGVRLSQHTPANVIDIINYMLDNEHLVPPSDLPNHPLFETQRWHFMLISDSCYFEGRTDSSMTYAGSSYELNVRCNLKNYDDEIIKFLDFINPYIKYNGFIGYTRWECVEDPTLIYKEGGRIKFKEPDPSTDEEACGYTIYRPNGYTILHPDPVRPDDVLELK